jgi:hypothetical protein
MKLFKLIIPALAVLALASSCTKEYNTYGVNIYSRYYTVTPSDWKRDSGDLEPGAYNYLYAEFENPDITNDVISAGTVQAYVYVIYNTDKNLGSWNPLPYVYPLEITTTDDSGTSTVVAPENLRFEFEPGIVTFIIQDLDGYDPTDITNSMSIKVSVTY